MGMLVVAVPPKTTTSSRHISSKTSRSRCKSVTKIAAICAKNCKCAIILVESAKTHFSPSLVIRIQILSYVREMDTKETPESADSTTIVPTQMRLTTEHEQNARVKEEEYHNIAINDFKEMLRRQPIAHHEMQQHLNNIYV